MFLFKCRMVTELVSSWTVTVYDYLSQGQNQLYTLLI